MSKPVTNYDFEKITLRLPRHLLQTLQESAGHKGLSVNAEILARLTQASIEERLDNMGQVTIEVRSLVKEILETVRPPR